MTGLSGFPKPVTAVVIGASGGLGGAMVDLLAADPAVQVVHAFARRALPERARVSTGALDLADEASIAAAAAAVGAADLVFVATGLLHDGAIQPEKTWRSLDAAALTRLFAVNTIGPALVAKHFLPLLPRQGRGVFAAISAKVGSITDNHLGGWYGYRAAKAALNQIVRTAAIELARTRAEALCVALHPGTVNTDLSRPFQAAVASDKLFTPAVSAAHMVAVLNGLGPHDSGGLFAWDGTRLPY